MKENLILQVTDFKAVDSAKQKLVKLKLSDGVSSLPAIMTQAQVEQSNKTQKQEVKVWAVIEVRNYIRK